ncbi:RM17-like protein [Mya arenaria]|uniref:Large ribosomal subunit protein bL17m n=1 Tax=Mya arenaria TaxID=6604 RepID=A0ABY7E916_MYAAR|nr:RM17-like protein [Mya arenaria]
MLRIQVKRRPRKLKGVLIGSGSGPTERIKYLQYKVNRLIRDERIEGREDRIHEIRGYAEQLLNLAIQNGDSHKPTMIMATNWLKEKELVYKLFQVLAPRYENYTTAFTTVHRLPANYPSTGLYQAVTHILRLFHIKETNLDF